MSDETSHIDIVQFLETRAAIPILGTIGTSGRQFKEIESDVIASPATISKRLQEAQNLGLLRHSSEQVGNKVVHLYYLTFEGELLHDEIARREIMGTYKRFANYRSEFNEEKTEFLDYIGDEEIYERMKVDKNLSENPEIYD